jgi:hypothetical protein
MTDLKTLPAVLDSVLVLKALGQLYYEQFHREGVCESVRAAKEQRGEEGRRDAIAEGAASVVEEVLGLFDLGACRMDDRLGEVHGIVYELIESDTGGTADDDEAGPLDEAEEPPRPRDARSADRDKAERP